MPPAKKNRLSRIRKSLADSDKVINSFIMDLNRRGPVKQNKGKVPRKFPPNPSTNKLQKNKAKTEKEPEQKKPKPPKKTKKTTESKKGKQGKCSIDNPGNITIYVKKGVRVEAIKINKNGNLTITSKKA